MKYSIDIRCLSDRIDFIRSFSVTLSQFKIIRENEIPGFGHIDFFEVKISMWAAPYLEQEIKEGRAIGMNTLLPEATGRHGGSLMLATV